MIFSKQNIMKIEKKIMDIINILTWKCNCIVTINVPFEDFLYTIKRFYRIKMLSCYRKVYRLNV